MSLETSSLPDELISEILEYTDCKTLLSCRTSCHRLKKIVDQSSTLQYIIELFGTGMCDGQSSGVNSAERLDRLRRSQMSWKSPTWREPADFPYSKKIRPVPAAVSGNLMVFYSFASSFDLRDLLLLRFPSELRGIPEQQWSLNLDCDIHSICVDDSQDLLCFFSMPNVHVRTLSTGEIHPLTHAVGPIYSFGSEFVGSARLRIYGDLLMMINALEHYILVINWRTGGHVVKIPSSGSEYTQCTFLDRTNIILSWDTNDDGRRKLHLRAVTLPNTADDAPLHSYDFELPTLKDNNFPGEHILCANTLPSNHCASYVPGLFHADPRGRLLALEMDTLVQETCADGLRQYSIFYVLYIPHDTILSYIKAQTFNTSTVIVPWQTWGLGNTRLISVPNAMLTYPRSGLVCGMHALTRHSEPLTQRESLRIMDYHPRRVARILATEDMYSPGEVSIRVEGPGCSNITVKQRSGIHTSQDKELPYALKEILFPNDLGSNIHYELGEDVVVLFEHAADNPTDMSTRIKRVSYHHI